MSVFVKIFRCILCCSEEDDHERDYENQGRDPLLRRSYCNSSVGNSTSNNHDQLRRQNPNNIFYFDYYPNVSISSQTTKQPSSVSLPSDYGNNSSMKGTNEVSPNLKSSRPEPLSSPYYTCPPSPKPPSFTIDQHKLPAKPQASSLKPSPSPSKSSPSLGGLSQSTTVPTTLSLKASTLSKPTLSSHPLDTKNQRKEGNHTCDQKGTSSVYMTPKDNENVMKKDSVPEVFKKPSSLFQKAPSSSKSTLSPLPSDSTEQQKWARYICVQKPQSSSLKPSPSPSKSSPSLGGSSQLTSVPTKLSLKAFTLFEPTLSPLPLDTKNQQKEGDHICVKKDTSPVYTTPKVNENLIKKVVAPEVFKKPSSLFQKAPSSFKPTLSPLPPDSTKQQKRASYVWVQKGTSSVYKIPKDVEDLIKEDIVPDILMKPMSPSTYKKYFAALLNAEDFYIEKWSDFELLDVTLELHAASIYDKSPKNNHLVTSHKKNDKFFVAFEIESVPEKRPFLLSRDFVFAQRSGGKSRKFQGLLYRVVKSTTVLVEFEEGFYPQHRPNNGYDISFSFNRVCLKRAHQAIAAASDSLFRNYLFPDCASRKCIPSSSPQLYCDYNLDSDINSAVRRILSFEGQPPYLVEGPLCLCRLATYKFVLSVTGSFVREAVVQIWLRSPKSRILICADMNRTCDVLMENLMKNIPESEMFRANAAFREVDTVPDDILQVSLLEGECFSCPSLQELMHYRIIFSTYVSSFRLHNEGITAGHFSHIFLLDTSSAIEPEILIALSNLANENTTVIATGAPRNRPAWVRSDIARKNGLKMSYFERLSQTETYRSCNPMFFTRLSEE